MVPFILPSTSANFNHAVVIKPATKSESKPKRPTIPAMYKNQSILKIKNKAKKPTTTDNTTCDLF